MTRFRSKPLAMLGKSWLARMWANSKCSGSGVSLRKAGDAVELRKGERAILLSPKHVFFAPEVCASFEVYAHALPATMADGVSTVDFAAEPGSFNLVRQCLRGGGRIENRGEKIWLHKDHRAMILSPRHFVYAWDLTEKFELYFSPLVPEEREGSLVLDYSTPGELQTYQGSGLQFEMASFPEEEDAIEEYFRWYRPQAGDTVFDIGAHCGVSTFYLSRLVGPEGKVVCFEPDPTNYAILLRNIERHGLTNVEAKQMAVAGSAGKLQFNSEGTIGSSLVTNLHRESVGSIVEVEALTLDDAFAQWGEPAFCKIDIEGAEVDVIAKSAELLRRCRTNFALDTNHPKVNGEMTSGEIETMFRSYGYEVGSEANPLLTTWARRPEPAA